MAKSYRFHLFSLMAFLSIFLFSGLLGPDEVVERVDVMNREVVVRVFDGGEPVPGLKKKDFTLLENGNPVTITSCRQVNRSLAYMPVSEETKKISARKPRARLFLFLLWWNEENPDWPMAWNYFLENIYRPRDQIILSTDTRAIRIQDPRKEKEKLSLFFQRMAVELKRKRMDKIRLIHELERCAREFHDNLRYKGPATSESLILNRFKGCYRGALDEYRLKRLRAQPGMIERLAAALRAVDAEKWAMLFLQNERLPMLHGGSRIFGDAPASGGDDTGAQQEGTLKSLMRFMNDCNRRMRMGTDMAVHVRDLRSLFIGAGATFHLFLSDAGGEMLDSDFLRWFPVFSSWESAFRGIARDTGGGVQDTTKLKLALEKAASRPDIYYVLTYKPTAHGPGKPKVKIRVSRPGLNAVYARKLRPRKIRPLQLSEPRWNEGALRFNISDYLRETGEGGSISGNLHVQVSTETLEGEPLEFEKALHPGDESIQVEMNVNFPEPGDYILTVAVTDRLSGNRARNYTRATIPPPEPEVREPQDPKLKAVLDKAEIYCRKLHRAAFRFTCHEVVEERFLEKNPVRKRVEPRERHWRYDYQVVVDGGEIAEQRRLVRVEHKRVNVQNAKLETRFKARYPVFLPVTLLGERNRKNYRYSLVETQRLQKRHCAVIEVTPHDAGKGPLARGRAWVDVDNGSVLKIEMDPRGVWGSAALEAAAKKMSARLDLKAVHWYLEAHKGLRFPSQVEFSESYVFDREVKDRKVEHHLALRVHGAQGPVVRFGYRMVKFYRMSQKYKKYRYFEVDTRVKIESLK